MSPLTRIGRALAGLVGGTILGFAVLIFGYVLFDRVTGHSDGDFGLGFGLVIAPALGLLFGSGMAVWLAISPRISAMVFLLGSFVSAILIYVLAWAIG